MEPCQDLQGALWVQGPCTSSPLKPQWVSMEWVNESVTREARLHMLTSPGCARPHCCHDHYLSSCAYVSCASFSSPSFSSSPFFPDSFATRKCPGHNHTLLLRLQSVLLGYGLCTDYSTWLLACGSMRGQDIIRVFLSTTGRVLTLVVHKGALD